MTNASSLLQCPCSPASSSVSVLRHQAAPPPRHKRLYDHAHRSGQRKRRCHHLPAELVVSGAETQVTKLHVTQQHRPGGHSAHPGLQNEALASLPHRSTDLAHAELNTLPLSRQTDKRSHRKAREEEGSDGTKEGRAEKETVPGEGAPGRRHRVLRVAERSGIHGHLTPSPRELVPCSLLQDYARRSFFPLV